MIALATAPAVHGAHAEPPPAQYVWKFGTLAPDGTSWALPIKRVLFPLIQRETGGQVKVKVYWGGSMGDDEDILRKIHIGQLDGAGFSAQGAALAVPETAVLELPFMFNDYNEVDIIKYSMFPAFDKIMSERGFFLIAWVDQDFDQIYSNGHPVAALQDFGKLKFGSWYGPVEEQFLKEFGANVIQVNVPELATAVRQGVVNASIGPAMWIVGAQLYANTEYVNPIRIRYSPGVILCRKEVWEAYPELEKYKQRLLELRIPLSEAYCTIVRADNQKALNAMIQYGIKPVATSPEEMARMKAIARTLWGRLAKEGMYPQELLDEVTARIQAYRDLETCPECLAKRQEVLDRVTQMRGEVLDIWKGMGSRAATETDLEDILARANEFNGMFGRAQKEISKAIRSYVEQAALETLNRVKTQGLWADPALRIALPDPLLAMQQKLRQSGEDEPGEALAKSLNQAASRVISNNRQRLLDLAVQNAADLDADAASVISMAGETSVTEYFEEMNRKTLLEHLGRDAPKAVAAEGVSARYKAFMDSVRGLDPGAAAPELDWSWYLTEKTVDALFTAMAQEEQKLRRDPSRQVLPVLNGILDQIQ